MLLDNPVQTPLVPEDVHDPLPPVTIVRLYPVAPGYEFQASVIVFELSFVVRKLLMDEPPVDAPETVIVLESLSSYRTLSTIVAVTVFVPVKLGL